MFQPEDLTPLFDGEPLRLFVGPRTKYDQYYLLDVSNERLDIHGDFWHMGNVIYAYSSLAELYHNQPKLRIC